METTPLLRCYTAGRLVNQARWLLEQEYTLGTKQWKRISKICALLQADAVHLVTLPENAHSFCENVRSYCSSREHRFSSEEFRDELWEIRQKYEGHGLTEDELRDEFSHLPDSIKEFDQVLREGYLGVIKTDPAQVVAYALGDVLDQGVRPRGSWLKGFTHETRQPHPGSPSVPFLGTYVPSGPTTVLIVKPVEPGSITPEEGWIDKVYAWWRKMGLPDQDSMNVNLYTETHLLRTSELVKELDEIAQTFLAAQHNHRPNPIIESGDGPNTASEPSASDALGLADIQSPSTEAQTPSSTKKIPNWDRDKYTLSYGEIECATYKREAPAQFEILNTFQDEGWPAEVKVNTSQVGDVATTISNLNSKLGDSSPIRFAVRTGTHASWKSNTED